MVNRSKTSIELTSLVAILISSILVVGIYGFLEIRNLNAKSKDLFTNRLIPTEQLSDVRYYISVILFSVNQASSGETTFAEAGRQIEGAQNKINTKWNAYTKTYMVPSEKQMMLETDNLLANLSLLTEKTKVLLQNGDKKGLQSFVKNELVQTLYPAIRNVTELRGLQIKVGEKLLEENEQNYNEFIERFVWILLLAFGFIVPFSYYLIRKNAIMINSFNLNNAKLFLTEKNYRNLIEYAGEAILLLNEETEIIDLNEYACIMLGYNRHEMQLMRIPALLASEDSSIWSLDIQNAEKDKFVVTSKKIRRKDGVILEAEISIRVMEGRGYFVVFRDVTERNRTEAKLKESEKKYRYLFDHNPACIFIWDLETLKILEVNEVVVKKYGYSKEEWSTMTLIDYRPAEEGEKVRNFVKHLRATDEPTASKVAVHLKKSGEEMLMDVSLHKILYNGRKAILSLATDVTAKMQVEMKLANSEKLYRALTENIGEAIVLINSDNMLEYHSPSVGRIAGYDSEEIKTKEFMNFIYPEDLVRAKEFFEKVRNSPGVTMQNQFRVRTKEGKGIWVEGAARNLLDQSGIGGIILNYRDISNRKKAEEDLINTNEQLKKANSELDRFVYSASHDLRAPLKSMSGLIEITKAEVEQQDFAEKDNLLERLDMFSESVFKLDNFIEDILNYSRNARMVLEYNEIDFDALMMDVTNHLQFSDEVVKVNLKITTDAQVKFVSDYKRLMIIMNNLVSNAYKYYDRNKLNSYIFINFSCDSENAVITIEDNGIGIKENKQEKIFEMFYRSSSQSTGSGIGLYIVKETLDKLEGTITVKSKLGEGSVFTVKIPNRANIIF